MARTPMYVMQAAPIADAVHMIVPTFALHAARITDIRPLKSGKKESVVDQYMRTGIRLDTNDGSYVQIENNAADLLDIFLVEDGQVTREARDVNAADSDFHYYTNAFVGDLIIKYMPDPDDNDPDSVR